ncbi:MAG: hypothetical protein OH316_02575 [Candidatus Parvarchaeota archaeon]|nr:hypothetical protein [Candidatus Parvarchaeota archaeon]MCW1301995.1 hypothetical protein [Candidatus Parvarchaeota archaeon]
MKSRKLRGSSTAGRGAGKRSRSGAGSRGGRGRAGGGKRGQQKFSSVKFYIKEGKQAKKIPLNLSYLQTHIDELKKEGVAEEREGKIYIDLNKTKDYTKICGSFKGNGLKLVVNGKVSEKAKASILENGGEIKG